ncbi:MAG: hypothetical protein Q9171_004136 [Xanthocarpia ochracea]
MALETYCGAMEYIFRSVVVEDLEHALSEEHRAFAFLYCNYKERAQQTFQNLISSLTRQLIYHSRTIPRKLRRLYQCSSDKQIRPSRQELLDLLTTVGSKFSSLYIVIDALDECDDTEEIRSSLVSTLCEALPRASFLVTSRHVPDIEMQFENCPRLQIKATEEDIRRYVSDQILRKPNLKKHIKADPNLRELMIETIGPLRCALESLPTELDNTYEEALQRIRDQNEENVSLAEDVLMWVLFAVVPLRVVELQHAIGAISLDGKTDIGDEDLTDPETLLDVCAGIVVIDKESKVVRLVHYTTQKYFDRHPLRPLPVAQCRITKTCITYLSLAPFNYDDSSGPDVLHDWYRQYPFVYYAGLHWGKHARGDPEDECRAQILEVISKENIRAITVYVSDASTRLCHERLESLAYAAAFGLTSIVNYLLNEGVDVNQANRSAITALISAVAAGNVDTVRALLAADADVNKGDNWWGVAPLVRAAGAGYVDTVRALLAANADVDRVPLYADTPLMKAADKGHDEIVQILLDNEANIEAAGCSGETALLLAAKRGFTSTVQLLIDKGAKMNAEDGLFQAAIESRSTAMVELAATKIGELTEADNRKNPLTKLIKCSRPSIATFELLIEKGADPTGSRYGEAPIQAAARKGNVKAVKSVLQHGVSPNIRDKDGYTPIHLAAFRGNHKMIEILVDHGANLTAQNDAGETGLHTLLRFGSDNNLVSLLVRRGVPVNISDAEGKTALHIAAHKGFDSTIKFLMEHGADGSSKDHGGRTPLETAAFSGNEKVVEQMLKHLAIPRPPHLTRLLAGARLRNAVSENDTVLIQEILKEPDLDLTIPEIFGRTALHFAAYYGQKSIVQSLLARGALVNARRADPARTDPNKMRRYLCEAKLEKFGNTPLQIATGQGHTDVVELLLKHGAELDATDDYGNTAFSTAVHGGNAKVIKVLLEHGSQVSESREGRRTPLIESICLDQEDVVRLLLENGADAERDTDEAKRALKQATFRGSHGIVELLKKHGFTTPRKTDPF